MRAPSNFGYSHPGVHTDAMASAASRLVEILVDDATRVSAILRCPRRPKACFVLAHGAGAGMLHPFMAAVADGLAALRIATLRYQFPYMEKQGKRPDPPALCHATVRAAVAAAHALLPSIPLVAGGKSFGGRMTSQAQGLNPLAGVRGLIFLGFPLHPPKRPSDSRALHLSRVHIPMLFLQGTRDALADMSQLNPLAERLGPRASLFLVSDADHSFHAPARSGRSDGQIMDEMLHAITRWTDALSGATAAGSHPPG